MTRILVVILVMGLLLLLACSQPATPELQPNISAEAREIRVEAFQFGYEPSRIEVDRGDTVRIIATSRDVPHGFALPQYGVNLRLTAGAEQTAEFVADTPGEFSFYCSIPCGSGHSTMRGTFVVR